MRLLPVSALSPELPIRHHFFVSKIVTFGHTLLVIFVKYCRTCLNVRNRRTRSAICSASSRVEQRASSLIVGTNAGLMLKLRRPMPKSGRKHLGRPAISPHKVAGF
jgi:hypothetical protein